MTVEGIRVSRGWLALREPADAAARAPDLAEQLRRRLPTAGRQVIHDLGCGTGAMGRWLAPRLPGPQHWVVHDRDADLLAVAAADLPGEATDGAAVTVETRQSDITRLDTGDLSDATLITASALLDLLTGEELAGLVTICAGAGCPVLLTLSVVGRVDLTPADPLDAVVAAAFDAHQRRTTEEGRLLGPDAVAVAVEGFGRLGAEVLVRPSPWRLGAFEADLAVQWFTGWVGAACEQQVELAAETDAYARRRLAEATAGQLVVTVDHSDLLVLPRRPPSTPMNAAPPRARYPWSGAVRRGAGRGNQSVAPSSRSGARMSRTVWAWARLVGAAVTFTVLVWRLGAGLFLDGVRTVDGRALAAAAGLAVLTTVCCAWRWKIVARGLGVDLSLPAAVAAYYRSLFLNVTLPGGVVGDVHRGVSHGRDVSDVGRRLRAVAWERSAGQVVQVVLTVVVLLALPSPVHSSMPLVAIAVVVVVFGVVLVARTRPGGGRSRWARVWSAAAGDIRDGLLARRAWLGIALASSLVVGGHAVTFLIAARTAGTTAPLSRMLPLTLLVMLAMVLPSVGGWGPREGVAAWVFGAAGLGAEQGVTIAVVYGVMVVVASLPGAAFLVVAWFRRTRPPGRPEPPLPARVPVAVRPDGAADA